MIKWVSERGQAREGKMEMKTVFIRRSADPSVGRSVRQTVGLSDSREASIGSVDGGPHDWQSEMGVKSTGVT